MRRVWTLFDGFANLLVVSGDGTSESIDDLVANVKKQKKQGKQIRKLLKHLILGLENCGILQ